MTRYTTARISEIRGAVRKPKKTAPVMIGPSEHEIQVAVIQWWGYACKAQGLPAFALFAVPNAGAGAQRGQAGKLKAEGVRPGVSDLFLTVPRGTFHGLYIEMKAPAGRVSEAQVDFQRFARNQGYQAEIARSFDQAVALIQGYLRGAP